MNERVMVRAAAMAGLALAVGGCSLPSIRLSTAAKTHPSPSPRISPTPSPSPSPETAAVPAPPSPQPLTCQIAVFGYQAGSGGFVTLPGGDFSLDPKSDVSLPKGITLYNRGTNGSSYDYAKSKWLPVPRVNVSPDGSSYAYQSTDSDGGIYVVDAVKGGAREVAKGNLWQVVEWRAPGIYAMQADPATGLYHGLYLIDTNTGAVRGLTARGAWQAIGQTAAWGTEVPSAVNVDTSHTIIRFDLTSGQIAAYFSQPGSYLSVVAFDEQDRPVIDASNDVVQQVWALNGANHADRIFSGPGNQSKDYLRISPPGVTDSHGVWFGTDQGLMLYTTTDGFKKMSATTGQVGGGCH
jgi:hypothetical protein